MFDTSHLIKPVGNILMKCPNKIESDEAEWVYIEQIPIWVEEK